MAANSTFKPSEGKREEFRRYLEKTGVMDALTKVLVSLYEEQDKPSDALTYIQNKLALQSGGETVDSLKSQLSQAQEKITALEKEISDGKVEGSPDNADTPLVEKPPMVGEPNPDIPAQPPAEAVPENV